MRGTDTGRTGNWLAIRGAGVVHSVADMAAHDAHSLAAQAPLTRETLAEPDITALPALLAAYYGETPAPALRRVPRYARFGLLAALRALHSAGWTRQVPVDAPVGMQEDADLTPQTMLALGTAHSGVTMSMDFMDSLLDQGPRLASPTAFSHAVNNMGAGLLSLLLGVRGSCQTISQFSLSFAGALHVAALALHSGRARRALVGAVDETDPRFALHAPSVDAPDLYAHDLHTHDLPLTQGAVFFCVEAAREHDVTQGVRVLWGKSPHSGDAGAGAGLTLLSGDARPTDGTGAAQGSSLCLAPHYGMTPLAQALDVFLALRQAHIPTIDCPCVHALYGRQATVEVRRQPA